jgi:hypothetical protein
MKPRVEVLPRRAIRGWLVAGVVLYGASLIYLFSTVAFGEEDRVRNFSEQVARRPPAPMRPLPVMADVPWPDIAMVRDPFASTTGK